MPTTTAPRMHVDLGLTRYERRWLKSVAALRRLTAPDLVTDIVRDYLRQQTEVRPRRFQEARDD